MINLQGQPAELRFTLEIKRAATGKVETYEMVGHATVEEAQALGAVEVPQPDTKQE